MKYPSLRIVILSLLSILATASCDTRIDKFQKEFEATLTLGGTAQPMLSLLNGAGFSGAAPISRERLAGVCQKSGECTPSNLLNILNYNPPRDSGVQIVADQTYSVTFSTIGRITYWTTVFVRDGTIVGWAHWE